MLKKISTMMSGNRSTIILVVLAATLVVLNPSIYAGITGKVSGVVVDIETNQVLVGATIRVAGTSISTSTDEDGEFFILNVPIGKYDIIVSHVGFELYIVKNVRVLMDLTTPVDCNLAQVTIELDKKTVVYANNATIQRDLTASRVIFTSDQLRHLPNIVDIRSVLSNYPGVITDRDNDIHVRGGRSGQLSYSYDGFSVQDPFTQESGIRIMPTALEELSLISGGFNAEYGEALSGVVNAVTREGSQTYHGSFRTYEGFTHPFNVNTGKWDDLKRNNNRSGSFDISGPLPLFNSSRNTFFAAGEYLRSNPSLPNSLAITYTGTSKLSLQPSDRFKLKVNFAYSVSSGSIFDHRDQNGVSFNFNLDGLPVFEQQAYLVGFSGNYFLNSNAIISARVSRFSTRYLETPRHLTDVHWSQWAGYLEDSNGDYIGSIQDDNYANDRDFSDEHEAVGFMMGDRFDPAYRFRKTVYNSVTASITSQLNKKNQFKTGFDLRLYNINRDLRLFYNKIPFREIFQSDPIYFSYFVQDKLEYDNFVINVGIRYDYQDIDISYNSTPEDTVALYKRADVKKRLSPRLGVSFPISEKSVMHFNYGVYYQLPRFQYLFANLEGNVSSGLPLLGNPDLKPEQTTSYELGLDHLIGSGLRIDVTAYVKDVSDLVTTRSSFLIAGNPVTSFSNGDYGTIKGFDISVEKLRQNDNLSVAVSYGFMIANGNGSDALEPYYTFITSTVDTLPPITEFPLDFDQRHTLTARLDYRVPAGWHGTLFGIRLPSDWGLSMVETFGSGLPFTKTASDGTRLGERNANRLPNFHRLDMRINKNFSLASSGKKLSFFVEVDNVFNRHNVINVYSSTGLPDDDNRAIGSGFALDQKEIDRLDRLYDKDPQNYSPPRTIRTGLELRF